MTKTILLTGATDGIGLAAAHLFAAEGHTLLIHGRNADKLAAVQNALQKDYPKATITTHQADLSSLDETRALCADITDTYDSLDVILNNAGVFKTNTPETKDGFDVRFMVNTIAPYLLTQALRPLLSQTGRIINLSSAAQAPVDLTALKSSPRLSDSSAYAQSKLALTMWSNGLASQTKDQEPIIFSINPGSLLATNMVKSAYGIEGHDLSIGAEILYNAALNDGFATANGRYFDNDARNFGNPHPDALVPEKNQAVIDVLDQIITKKS